MNHSLLQDLPLDFASWPPLGQAAVLFLATFVLEDAAALGAGLLFGADRLDWPVAFWSCFLGIWIGDVGLYTLARGLGRRWFERSRFARHAAAVGRCERWFARHGARVLLVSRMIPGSRLPTYLAAGFLRVPITRFLAITGLAAFLWTALVLKLSRPLGNWLHRYFQFTSEALFWTVSSAGMVMLLWCAVRKNVSGWHNHPWFNALRRWTRWEFWPPWLFYTPVAVYCGWLAIRHRGLSLPAAANPGIFTGGLIGESKMAILTDLMRSSPEFTSPTALINGTSAEERVRELHAACARLGIGLPLVIKPDLGQRGAGVRQIRTWEQASETLRGSGQPMLVQRYSPGPMEVGVYYYRFPGHDHGRILAITEKVFPRVLGDGVSTLAQLIDADPRARLLRDTYLKRFASRADEILAAGEQVQLVEAGNHAQGCIFRDGTHLLTPALEQRIDAIALRLDRFHIGRFDIRYPNPEALARGTDFEIVELNGASAEATSIYDSRHSLWSAYRMLFRQWNLVFAIGAANRRAGWHGASWREVLRQWWRYRKVSESYPVAD